MAKFQKGRSGNPKGRPKGQPNKVTATAKQAIEKAAHALGGDIRLAAWAKESPENERAFWCTIFPKLLPLQVSAGDGENPSPMFAFPVPPQLSVEEWQAMVRAQQVRSDDA